MFNQAVYKVGAVIDILYPKHGRLNILRSVKGEVVHEGTGPNGPYITVKENKKDHYIYRCLSLKKIVVM